MNVSVVRRIELLEVQLKPFESKLPCVDFDLLIVSEQAYFSSYLKILRMKSRELGYGDRPEANLHTIGWFDLGDYDPVINREVRAECFEALNEHETKIVETLKKIIEKCIRLTAILSDEEKDVVRKFNEVKRFFGCNLASNESNKESAKQELAELSFQYNRIMTKYGEKIFSYSRSTKRCLR